ncbi:MAG: hypothetical protein MUO51_12095 [Woeseiaceae bacterium]|nr:hypothetical protein [Woeseiaceae bacterium]
MKTKESAVRDRTGVYRLGGDTMLLDSNGKKQPKALPPGIEKNLARGKPLPPGLIALRPSPPHGFERIIVDGKVLLVEVATNVIHDILTDVILR